MAVNLEKFAPERAAALAGAIKTLGSSMPPHTRRHFKFIATVIEPHMPLMLMNKKAQARYERREKLLPQAVERAKRELSNVPTLEEARKQARITEKFLYYPAFAFCASFLGGLAWTAAVHTRIIGMNMQSTWNDFLGPITLGAVALLSAVMAVVASPIHHAKARLVDARFTLETELRGLEHALKHQK